MVAVGNANITELHPGMYEFIEKMESLLDEELVITSGYRGPNHPIEAAKSKPGEHSTGLAIDVAAVGGSAVFNLVEAAIECGCKRIGINRKNNFVHLGLDSNRVTSIWTY